ncbi:MAG: hypothetical protein Q8L78_00015 [Coxiellaceae bacterium]|nr:hypothetical protein [Coxiellaceae bacterium]
MPKSVFIKHLEVPRKAQAFQAHETLKATMSNPKKNQIEHPRYLAATTKTQQTVSSDTRVPAFSTNPAALTLSVTALVAFLGVALAQASAAQEKQNPKPQKRNRHRLTTVNTTTPPTTTPTTPTTAMDEICNVSPSFNDIL